MTTPSELQNNNNSLSVEEIEAKISELTLLKSEMLAAEEEFKKSKKDKKKDKMANAKIDIKVPKVNSTTY
jgi:hypothetical protein